MTDLILEAYAEDIRERWKGLLILYYQLFHGVTEAELLKEIREFYQGDVVSGKDLEIY